MNRVRRRILREVTPFDVNAHAIIVGPTVEGLASASHIACPPVRTRTSVSHVVSGLAAEGVVAFVGDHHVVTAVALSVAEIEPVIAGASEEAIVAEPTPQLVGALLAVDLVVAGSVTDHIVPRPRAREVVTVSRMNHVVAAKARDHVWAVSTDQVVVPLGADDGGRHSETSRLGDRLHDQLHRVRRIAAVTKQVLSPPSFAVSIDAQQAAP